MLLTMPDLTWTVRVDGNRYTWVYTFSRLGTVRWQSQFDATYHGSGTWRIEGDKLVTRWFPSKAWDEWDMPIDPTGATGKCHMDAGETYNFYAVPRDWYLEPGDVVYSGTPLIRTKPPQPATIIHYNEVRSGGTVAWICKNPGNVKVTDWVEKQGAFKGKKLVVAGISGAFAIFPDEETGLNVVVSVLKGYGHVTLLEAMNKYAGKEDPGNKPNEYAAGLAAKYGKGVDPKTFLTDLDLKRLAELITGVETTTPGDSSSWENAPDDIRQRLRLSRPPFGPQP
jgi:hypothetical protein